MFKMIKKQKLNVIPPIFRGNWNILFAFRIYLLYKLHHHSRKRRKWWKIVIVTSTFVFQFYRGRLFCTLSPVVEEKFRRCSSSFEL